MNLLDTGEFKFIQSIEADSIYDASQVVAGIGDDCAVYQASDSLDQLVSVDTMVEGIHFTFSTMAPRDVGIRLCTANLSDIAAMGGVARHILVSVAANGAIPTDVLKEIYAGIKEQCHKYCVNIIGGDTVSTTGPLVLTITVIGEVRKGKACMRSHAQVGDLIGVTHYLGDASAGLDVILAGQEKIYSDLVKAHRRPEPQLALGQLLLLKGAHAMNDISDGLASEIHEIADTSKVNVLIEEDKIPISPQCQSWSQIQGKRPSDYALYGGEDFQLLFTVPQELQSFLEEHGKFTIIGRVIEKGTGCVEMRRIDGKSQFIEKKGYNHFNK